MTLDRSACPAPGRTATCLIADDHPAVLDAVSRYLAARGLTVSATAADGDDALEKIERGQPDVAILDVEMPGTERGELISRAHAVSPETAVIVYTGHAEGSTLSDALDAGARGVVLKHAPLDDLMRAIEMAKRGDLYVDPGLAGGLLAGRGSVELTERERQILRLVADGLTNEEIGAELYLSPQTVRAHVTRVCRKLDARTRAHAAATAIRLSLIG